MPKRKQNLKARGSAAVNRAEVDSRIESLCELIHQPKTMQEIAEGAVLLGCSEYIDITDEQRLEVGGMIQALVWVLGVDVGVENRVNSTLELIRQQNALSLKPVD